mmetsp:Transcript_89129/g.195272  ORF Transcript_89129/g.195272 Transcript_89129/m.195272 type:complete len:271 (-) Transcript_89129:519-1331(-)
MGKVHDSITPELAEWLLKQRLFFVGTAPRVGSVNVSPKGYAQGTFRILTPHKVAYLDCTGSGAETFAHLTLADRLTLLFVELEAKEPGLLRLHGHARAWRKEECSEDLKSLFDQSFVDHRSFRSIVVLEVERVSTSCGYSIPFYAYREERTRLLDFSAKMSEEEINEYRILKNSFTIDGLPTLAHRVLGAEAPIVRPTFTGGYWYGKRVSGNAISTSICGFWERLRLKLLQQVAAMQVWPLVLSHCSVLALGAIVGAAYVQQTSSQRRSV